MTRYEITLKGKVTLCVMTVGVFLILFSSLASVGRRTLMEDSSSPPPSTPQFYQPLEDFISDGATVPLDSATPQTDAPPGADVPDARLYLSFEPDSAELSDTAKAQLLQFVRKVPSLRGLRLFVEGIISPGDVGDGEALALERASIVSAHLTEIGVSPENLVSLASAANETTDSHSGVVVYFIRRLEK